MTLRIRWSGILDALPRPKHPKDVANWLIDFEEYCKPYNKFKDMLKNDQNYTKCEILEVGNSCYKHLLKNAKHLNGLQFYIDPIIQGTDIEEAERFILVSSSEFPHSYMCSSTSKIEEISFVNPEAEYPVKVIKKVCLKSFPKVRDDRIYEHKNGFLISKELAKRLQEANFDGYELTPAKACRGKKEYDYIFCLTATNILPSSEHNVLRYEWQEEDEDNKTLPYEGTLIYKEKVLTVIQDFIYPCEATYRDGRADILVSKRFKEFCEKEKIKGVDFIPVLTKESDLYKEYVRQVQQLCRDLINSNPKHRIGFSKIDPVEILKSLKLHPRG